MLQSYKVFENCSFKFWRSCSFQVLCFASELWRPVCAVCTSCASPDSLPFSTPPSAPEALHQKTPCSLLLDWVQPNGKLGRRQGGRRKGRARDFSPWLPSWAVTCLKSQMTITGSLLVVIFKSFSHSRYWDYSSTSSIIVGCVQLCIFVSLSFYNTGIYLWLLKQFFLEMWI